MRGCGGSSCAPACVLSQPLSLHTSTSELISAAIRAHARLLQHCNIRNEPRVPVEPPRGQLPPLERRVLRQHTQHLDALLVNACALVLRTRLCELRVQERDCEGGNAGTVLGGRGEGSPADAPAGCEAEHGLHESSACDGVREGVSGLPRAFQAAG
jgi:hypothetical protein